MLSSLLTTLTTMLHHLVPQPKKTPAVPLTDLPLDVVLHVLDRLDAPALAALGRTSKALHALCAPRLFAAVELASPKQLAAFLSALRANPHRGPAVRALTERGLAAHPAQLQAALELAPRLRALRLHSAVAGLDLAPLSELQELHLLDATRGTLAILPSLPASAPLAALGVHCWPAALPGQCPPPELAGALSAFLDARPTLRALEADAAVLADVAVPSTIGAVTLHGGDGAQICEWCAPPGAMWEDREAAPAGMPHDKSARLGYWARANVALCRWLLAVTGLSGGF